ncbi:MAG: hypothetical protein WCJ26_13320 [bacterium]
MKKYVVLLVLIFLNGLAFGQRTLMVEKIGTSRKYFFHTGDYIKLRVSKQDTLLKGKLWSIHDSLVSVSELRPFDVRLNDIGSVYKQFAYPKKFARIVGIGSAAIFAIITFNHLVNNEQVFTPDMFIISGSLLGASLISLSLSEKRCKMSRGWKVKVLDVEIN